MHALCVWATVAILFTANAERPALGNRHLVRAQRLVDNLRYPAAAKELDLALEVDGNDRPTLLRILELRAIIAAILNQPERATIFFRTLLAMDPKHTLSEGEYSPRVTTIFYQTKGWIAEREPLQFSPVPPQIERKRVEQIGARVRPDPLGLGKRVRFHTRIGNQPWMVSEVNIGDGDVVWLLVNAESIDWWGELIGERNAILSLIGAAEEPIRARLPLPPPPPRVDPPSPKLLAEIRTKAIEEARQEIREPPFRSLSYALMGGGVAAAGIGTYFGWKSVHDRRRIDRATTNSQGLVSGISQRDAFDLDKQVRLEATLANVLWLSGAALAASGAALFFLGGRAAVAPTPGGFSIEGKLP